MHNGEKGMGVEAPGQTPAIAERVERTGSRSQLAMISDYARIISDPRYEHICAGQRRPPHGAWVLYVEGKFIGFAPDRKSLHDEVKKLSGLGSTDSLVKAREHHITLVRPDVDLADDANQDIESLTPNLRIGDA